MPTVHCGVASGEGVWTPCSVSLGDAPSGGPGGDSGGSSANSRAGAAGLSVEMHWTMLDRQSRLDTAALSPGLDSVGEGKVSNARWSPFKPLPPAQHTAGRLFVVGGITPGLPLGPTRGAAVIHL